VSHWNKKKFKSLRKKMGPPEGCSRATGGILDFGFAKKTFSPYSCPPETAVFLLLCRGSGNSVLQFKKN